MRVTAREREPALPPRALAAGKLTVARILSLPRRLSAASSRHPSHGSKRRWYFGASETRRRKTARGIATASFPLRSVAAWRTRRPVGLPPASRSARCRESVSDGCTRMWTYGGRPLPCPGTDAGWRSRAPGRARREAGTRPQRFRRASSVPAFRMPRITADVLSRVTDAAPNQRLDARGAQGMSGGSRSRPPRGPRRADCARWGGSAPAGAVRHPCRG